MDRVKALARIDAYFQTGKFESDLNRRIAFKTESNLPNSVNALQSYLEKEIAPYLSAMGFSCTIYPNPITDAGPFLLAHRIEGADLPTVMTYGHGDVVAGYDDQGVVIAEGMVDFDYEITLLTVRAKDSKGVITTHYCEPIGHRQENGDYVESWQPQPMSDNALLKSKEMAKKVTDALGGLGLFGVELFIKGDEVLFSEASPRPHDTGMVTMMTQRQSEFELHAKAILGLPVDTQLINPGASAVIYGNLDAEAIMFEGVDKALAIKGVDVRLFGKPQSFKKRRMGVILAEGKDISEARSKAQQAQALIKTKVQ